MNVIRQSKTQLFLVVCSLAIVGIAAYLTSVHYENVPLVCSDKGLVDCARVLSSSYSVVPGTSIPISAPGLLWGLVSASLAIFALRTQRSWLPVAQFVWVLIGMLTVLYLVYVEIVRLHTICAWCTAMHVLILLMFLVAVVQLQRQRSDFDLEMETEDEESVTTTPSHSK